MTTRRSIEQRIVQLEARRAPLVDLRPLLASLPWDDLVELEELLSEPPDLLCHHCGSATCAMPRRRRPRETFTARQLERIDAILRPGRTVTP